MRLTLQASAIFGDVIVPLLLLLAPARVDAAAEGLWLQPSSKWVGVDGNWSTFELAIGGPAVTVQLIPNTVLSEIWAVSNKYCKAPQCIADRGGIYDPKSSRSFSSLGTWSLGLKTAGVAPSNGDYGLETVAMYNSILSTTNDVDSALVASYDTIDFYQGYIGLGVTAGKFNTKVVNPFISQLAETYGTIPSHSYGYTAGFVNHEPSVPASLILGGYDPKRFIEHNFAFRLNDDRQPYARLRGINIDATDPTKAPSKWNASSTSLVSMSDDMTVLIDSTFPYITLPQAICDRFADALGLVYNDTLEVYTYSTMDQYNSFLKSKPYNFTFSLSAWDNMDNFGKPLETRGVVNITLSSAAFAHVLRSPYKNTIPSTSPSIPYFPLRRAKNTNEFALGRVFLQEAYIITKYDEEVFSVYQARFPPNAASNYSVMSIARSPNSQYPEYHGPPPQDGPALNTGQTAGIVIAVLLVSGICAASLWYCRRRRRRRRSAKQLITPLDNQEDELKDNDSALKPPDTPVSPVTRMFTFLQHRRRSRMPRSPRPVDDPMPQAAEVGADASHERYEMPAPPPPVELAANDIHSSDETTELGTESSEHNLSEYELARRKIQRQLQGPLPTYTPPTRSLRSNPDGGPVAAEEGKSPQDASPVAHYRPVEIGESSSPVSPPSEGNDSNSLPNSLPSPMTPRDPDWGTMKMYDLPSPMTVASQYPPAIYGAPSSSDKSISNPSPTQPSFYGQSHLGVESAAGIGRAGPSSRRGGVGNVSPTSSASAHSPLSDAPPSPTFQHTPIDHEEIVCLGPLPENVRLPLPNSAKPRRQPSVPRLIGPEGRMVTASPIPEDPADAQHSAAAQRPDVAAPPRSPSRIVPPPPVVVTPSSSRRPVDGPRHQLRIDPGLSKRGSARRGSADTLGSNFTVEEEEDEVRVVQHTDPTRQQSLRGGNGGGSSQPSTPLSPQSCERIDAASELIHVPQVPDKRYSWEEDKR